MAPSFGSERGKSIQAGFERGKASRSWRDSQRGLVCGKAVAQQAGIKNTHPMIFAALARACATVLEANWNRFSFSLATLLCRLRSATSAANRSFKTRGMIDLEFQWHSRPPERFQALAISRCWR